MVLWLGLDLRKRKSLRSFLRPSGVDVWVSGTIDLGGTRC